MPIRLCQCHKEKYNEIREKNAKERNYKTLPTLSTLDYTHELKD